MSNFILRQFKRRKPKCQEGFIFCGLSIAKVELLAKELTDIYKTLSVYELLPKNFNSYHQTAFI